MLLLYTFLYTFSASKHPLHPYVGHQWGTPIHKLEPLQFEQVLDVNQAQEPWRLDSN